MNLLSIILSSSSSGGEALFIGGFTGLVMFFIIRAFSKKQDEKIEIKVTESTNSLVKLAVDMSESTKELYTDTNRNEIQIESILLFSSLIFAYIKLTVDKNVSRYAFMNFVPEIKSYLKENYPNILSNDDIEILVDERMEIFLTEIITFLNDKSYMLPKITDAFFRSSLKVELSDYFGAENQYFNSNLLSWYVDLREPYLQWLSKAK